MRLAFNFGMGTLFSLKQMRRFVRGFCISLVLIGAIGGGIWFVSPDWGVWVFTFVLDCIGAVGSFIVDCISDLFPHVSAMEKGPEIGSVPETDLSTEPRDAPTPLDWVEWDSAPSHELLEVPSTDFGNSLDIAGEETLSFEDSFEAAADLIPDEQPNVSPTSSIQSVDFSDWNAYVVSGSEIQPPSSPSPPHSPIEYAPWDPRRPEE